MVTREIKRFVDVEITKESSRISAAAFGDLLVVTDSALLSTTRRVRQFTTAQSVSDFFGASSEEYKAADAFFFQDPALTNHPEKLYFGRFADAATAALLECGDSPLTTIATWAAVTDGEFTIDIDGGTVNATGLDFSSVTSLDDVATVIDTELGANGDCYYLGGRFNINSATTGASSTITVLDTVAAPAGTDISGSGFLDGDIAQGPTNLGGSILSQGQALETFADGLTAIENIDNSWYAMGALKKYRDVTATENMADEIESRRKMFLIATNDSNVLVNGSTSTFSYYVRNANYKRSATIYHDNSNLYPDMSWMGQQLPKDVGKTNWAFRELAGIAEGAESDVPAVALTQAEIDAAYSVNCNVYTETLAAAFVHPGLMGGGRNADKDGEWIDIVRDIDFLQARVEEGLISLLLEKDIIPFTNAGISMVDNRLKSRLDEFGVKQGILVEGSVVTSFPKRSDVSTADRDNRILPDGAFTGELQGAVGKVIVRAKVFI
jgi:hypothetical protein